MPLNLFNFEWPIKVQCVHIKLNTDIPRLYFVCGSNQCFEHKMKKTDSQISPKRKSSLVFDIFPVKQDKIKYH